MLKENIDTGTLARVEAVIPPLMAAIIMNILSFFFLDATIDALSASPS
jgi:hypothetical protein